MLHFTNPVHTGRMRSAAALMALSFALLLPFSTPAQTSSGSVRALRQTPTERFVVNAGVRDWGPASTNGTLVVAGGPTGKAGLFAVDAATGRLRWTFRPREHNGSVSTPPALTPTLAIAPFGAANPGAVIAVRLSDGREAWRGPDPATHSAVAVHDGRAFVLDKSGRFHALDAATGAPVWSVQYRRTSCTTRPLVAEGMVLVGLADVRAGTANDVDAMLVALDAATGQERWRFTARVPGQYPAACPRQPVRVEDLLVFSGDERLYAVDLRSGQERWPSREIRGPEEGRQRLMPLLGLTDAGGGLLAGITRTSLRLVEAASGRTVWELPGRFSESNADMAVADGVLYFQGSPEVQPAPRTSGTLYALDLTSRNLLWDFSRNAAEPWPFGAPLPVDQGVWIDHYQALLLLR